MFYCKIQDAKVVDRAVFDDTMADDWPDRSDWIESDEAQIGWLLVDGFLTAPPVVTPPVTIPDLAPYQFRAMLKLSGRQDQLYAFIATLPEPDRTVAQSKLEYSLVFKFDNDLVQTAREAMAIPMQEFKALWLQAHSIL